ncbi:MAG: hypothetical protein IKW51_00690 [Bacteroidales bacterium]|nr:hypothetical protein [Bacteroidales bacterium]
MIVLYLAIFVYLVYHLFPIVAKWMLFIILFPIMPFFWYRDKQIRNEYPVMSKVALVMWILALALMSFVLLMDKLVG